MAINSDLACKMHNTTLQTKTLQQNCEVWILDLVV